MTVTSSGKCVYYAYTGRIDDEGATRIATVKAILDWVRNPVAL